MHTEKMNGKAHTSDAPKRFDLEEPDEHGEIEKPKLVFSLRVKRVEPGDNFFVRLLSREYGGMFTHYYQKRSYFCPGDSCKCPVHNNPQSFTWKGYCAAELYDDVSKLWCPIVLEITERLEQDFRHRFARGQVWNLFRYAAKKTGEPVMGTLHEKQDEAQLPPSFEILPVLRTMYHWNGIMPLTAKNPLPDRVLVQPSQGCAPLALEPTQDKFEEQKRIESFEQEYERQRKEFSAKKRKGN
jgi:hypothetical protein